MKRVAAALLVLTLPAVAQDSATETLTKHVRAYAKENSPQAKAEILKAGPAAIRVLIEERTTLAGDGFDRLSDLACTLRFKANSDARARFCRDRLAQNEMPIEGVGELPLTDLADTAVNCIAEQMDREEGAGSTFTLEVTPKQRVPIFFDPVVCPEPAQVVIRYPAGYIPTKSYLELDRALATHGLDWTIRYGVLLISTPGRLWPSPGARPKLTDAQRAHLKQLVADLESTELETRDRAGRELMTFGPEAVEPLEALKGSTDATGRAREIAARIRSLHADYAFNFKAAVDDQKLEGDDLKIAELLKDETRFLTGNAVAFKETRLDAAASSLGRAAGVVIDVADEIADLKITLDADGIRLRDALMLVTRTHGFDFEVREGRLVIAPPKKK